MMDKIAIFKDLNDDGYYAVILDSRPDCNEGKIMTYDVVGQHCEASIEYVSECNIVSDHLGINDGVQSLINDLKQVGYNIELTSDVDEIEYYLS